jgi:hypothetical protein
MSTTSSTAGRSSPDPIVGDGEGLDPHLRHRACQRIAVLAIEHELGAEIAQEPVALRARRPRDPHPAGDGELHQQAAHPARCAVDHEPVARRRTDAIEQLQRRGAGERHRGGLDRVERGRPRRDQRRLQRDVLRIRAPPRPADRQHRPVGAMVAGRRALA